MDEQSLDKTALSTISLLEARLLRIEQILYGTASAQTVQQPADSTLSSLADLERRFSTLISRFRVYADILKLCTLPRRDLTGHIALTKHDTSDRSHPTFFTSPAPTDTAPPTELDTAAVRATVLSFASAFPSTVSALTAVTSDTPIPDPSLSAELVSLLPRMKGLEATQTAQEAEIAELRTRSEAIVGKWYEERVVGYGNFIADVEGRVERVERGVRRLEGLKAKEAEIV